VNVESNVFRAYDIRGLVGEDFDAPWVLRLGRALGAHFREAGLESAVVGHDCRRSSPEYHDALAQGLLAGGVSVISLGMAPTPLVYFAIVHLKRRAGVVITASHNPAQYNGFKIWMGESTIFGAELQKIRQRMEREEKITDRGVLSRYDARPDYEAAVAARIRLESPIRVVIDGGNGAGGELCARVFRRLGATVIPLYCEPDGDFPHHHPDPVVEDNMRDLIRTVEASGAGMGIGLDGDADRVGVADRRGRLLNGDELLGIYAQDLLRRRAGAAIIGDVKCSQRLFAAIEADGGRAVMSATGHSLIKARMRKEGALLAGEMSGHMFFADEWFGFDDGIYAAARLAGIVSAGGRLEELPGWPESFATREINVPCPDHLKDAVMERARRHFAAGGQRLVELDGVRVHFADGWGLIRPSNTQPAFVARFEADTRERMETLRSRMLALLDGWIRDASRAKQEQAGFAPSKK
jgi:phosphomannomutase/phosphoglucomutase